MYRITELHGGQIGCISTPGQGSKLCILLEYKGNADISRHVHFLCTVCKSESRRSGQLYRLHGTKAKFSTSTEAKTITN